MSEKAVQAAESSTGFIVVERLLAEMRGKGKSPDLEKWSAQLRDGLAKYRDVNKSPKAAKETQAVEKAFQAANELIQRMAAEAVKS